MGCGRTNEKIRNGQVLTRIQYFLVITAAYVFCHGLTALVVTPIQEKFLSDITIFASLVYLPHGVRVLATWLWGWKAFLPLCLGTWISAFLFNPADVHQLLQENLVYSVAAGSASALIAFEFMRLLGRNLYADQSREMNWRCLLMIGAVASLVNSIGNSIVYSGVILPDDALYVFVTYAVGDVIGLFVSMLGLMMIFRWIRLYQETI